MWISGWLFITLLFSQMLIVILYLYFKDPELLKERTSGFSKENQRSWDKYFFASFMFCTILWLILMPLDSQRSHLTALFPIYIKVIGAILTIVSSFLVSIALIYLGGSFWFIGVPLFLNSKYGFVFGVLLTLSLIFRIFGEEKMLMKELQEYKEYQKAVKYRLIPFVW